MKTIILAALTLLSISLAQAEETTITFKVWMSPINHSIITYEKNGQNVFVHDNQANHDFILTRCIDEEDLTFGTFSYENKLELKAKLKEVYPLTNVTHIFKAKKLKGCPEVERYYTHPSIAVTAYVSPIDTNDEGTVCSSLWGTVNDCMEKIKLLIKQYQ